MGPSIPPMQSTVTVDVEAWTVSALQALSVGRTARGIGAPLSIPLDELHGSHDDIATASAPRMQLRQVRVDDGPAGTCETAPSRPPSRRDSMRRRDALLKGNEGSRQRRRWENDRLMHVPNVEPPLPMDWDVRPTHSVKHVPYHMAQYWEKGVRERAEERKAAFAAHRKKANAPVSVAGAAAARAEVGKVPRDLHATAKRTPAVGAWLRRLEEPVRRVLVASGVVATEQTGGNSSEEEMDSEDDEIVFVGRNGSMRDAGWKRAARLAPSALPNQPVESGMVIESSGQDERAAAFERWLCHSISDYYGLHSRSLTMGSPAKRVVYVGIKRIGSAHMPRMFSQLPPPLWQMF